MISARTVELSPDTRLEASSLLAGRGGTIDVWSNSRTRAWGSVLAKGGRDATTIFLQRNIGDVLVKIGRAHV